MVQLPGMTKALSRCQQLRGLVQQQSHIEAVERAMKAYAFSLQDCFLARPATVEAP